MSSGKKPGDGPDDPADEARRRHVIRLEVSGATYATFREMMAKVRRDAGEPLDDDAAVMLVARHVLGGPKDPGRSSYQVKLDVCQSCRRGWQEGRGQSVEVAPEVVRDGRVRWAAARGDPVAEQKPTWGHGLEPLGCQSACWTAKSEAGEGDAVDCAFGTPMGPAPRSWLLRAARLLERKFPGRPSHHPAAKRAAITTPLGLRRCAARITKPCTRAASCSKGRASERLAFFHADGTPYGALVSPDVAELKTKAFQALRHMGFKETEARRALDAIKSDVGTLTLETIVRQALSVLT